VWPKNLFVMFWLIQNPRPLRRSISVLLVAPPLGRIWLNYSLSLLLGRLCERTLAGTQATLIRATPRAAAGAAAITAARPQPPTSAPFQFHKPCGTSLRVFVYALNYLEAPMSSTETTTKSFVETSSMNETAPHKHTFAASPCHHQAAPPRCPRRGSPLLLLNLCQEGFEGLPRARLRDAPMDNPQAVGVARAQRRRLQTLLHEPALERRGRWPKAISSKPSASHFFPAVHGAYAISYRWYGYVADVASGFHTLISSQDAERTCVRREIAW